MLLQFHIIELKKSGGEQRRSSKQQVLVKKKDYACAVVKTIIKNV